jgi:dephospho-CoA kinase
MLATKGAEVIDVDALGRAVIAPGGSAEAAVLAHFGPGVAGADGSVDRGALAALVFSSPAALARLEGISHPAINREIDARLDEIGDHRPVVLDMAILYGSRLGLDLPSGRRYTTVVVVQAPEDVRIERLVTARGMSEVDARARIASQPSDAQRCSIADHVITNDAGLEGLWAHVDALCEELRIGRSTPPTIRP